MASRSAKDAGNSPSFWLPAFNSHENERAVSCLQHVVALGGKAGNLKVNTLSLSRTAVSIIVEMGP